MKQPKSSSAINQLPLQEGSCLHLQIYLFFFFLKEGITTSPKDTQRLQAHRKGKGADSAPHEDKGPGGILSPILHAVFSAFAAHVHPISRGHAEIQVSRLKAHVLSGFRKSIMFSSTQEKGLGSLSDIFTRDFLPAKRRSDVVMSFFFFFGS